MWGWMSPSSPAYAQEPSLEFPQIAPGVDLEDLDIPAPIVLSADQPIVAAVGTFADNPQTESEWLGFELGFRASYPTPDSSAGQAVLSVSVDGRTAVQILIQQDESGVTASGAGWLEGDKLIEGGLVDVEGEYANYLQTGTVAPGEVSVVLQLELPTDDSGLSVVVDPGSGFRRLDESPFALSLSVVEVEEIGDSTVEVHFGVDSSRDDEILGEVSYFPTEAAGQEPPPGQEVTIRGRGRTRGQIIVAYPESGVIDGVLLFASSGFNSPAVPLRIVRPAAHDHRNPVAGMLIGGAVLGLGLLVWPGLASTKRRHPRSDG